MRDGKGGRATMELLDIGRAQFHAKAEEGAYAELPEGWGLDGDTC